MSWDTYFCVSPELDLGVQLFARVAPTPDDYLRAEQFKKHIHSQLLPWRCLSGDKERVHRAVTCDGFVFVVIPEAETEAGWVSGVITMPGTNPQVGMFHLVLDWRQFGERPIAITLERSGTLAALPGMEAGTEVWLVLEKLFGNLYAPPSDELLVALPDHVRGVPINHARRVIEFLRLRKRSSVDSSAIDIEAMKVSLSNTLGAAARVLEFECESFEASETVNRYALFVEPPLEVSSAECVASIEGKIAQFFDSFEDRVCDHSCDTHQVLSADGQIEFEPEGDT